MLLLLAGTRGGECDTSHVDNRVIKAARPVWAIAQHIDFPLAVFRFPRGVCIPDAIFLGN